MKDASIQKHDTSDAFAKAQVEQRIEVIVAMASCGKCRAFMRAENRNHPSPSLHIAAHQNKRF